VVQAGETTSTDAAWRVCRWPACEAPPVTTSDARRAATESILDAAERLLNEVGYAGITTRRLAEQAGVNQGLVHYYFGSMEEVLLQTLERFTARLTERQRAMYASDTPFIEKWRTAMSFLDEDMASGYEKIQFELSAMGWNQPEIRDRLQRVHQEWLDVLLPAFELGLAELGIDSERFPTKAVVSLVVTFNQGISLERLIGFDSGHRDLLAMIERLFAGMTNDTTGG
jgi:AcrR family transcriptional regulator